MYLPKNREASLIIKILMFIGSHCNFVKGSVNFWVGSSSSFLFAEKKVNSSPKFHVFETPLEGNDSVCVGNRVNTYRGVKYKCTQAFEFAEG